MEKLKYGLIKWLSLYLESQSIFEFFFFTLGKIAVLVLFKINFII